MTPFSTPFGRLHSIRIRDPKKKPVHIDLDAANQYQDAGPSSANLLTPRPHHYRSTTPSPATPMASSFASSSSSSASSSASSGTRFVSSPTFVSSSALATGNAFPADWDALTPPLSPVLPNSAAAAQATKSPIRRALSRTFFFASSANTHATTNTSTSTTNNNHNAPHQSSTSPILARAPRPARPARPATSPATGLSPNPNAFGFTASAMTRSQTSCPVIITTSHDTSTRRRSRTLMPPVSVVESESGQSSNSTCQRSASPTDPRRFSRTPSPLPIVEGGSSASAALSSSSPPTSLRSIRQMHARKSIHSIFAATPSAPLDSAPESAVLGAETTPLEALPRVSSAPRLSRRASQESFHCRGPGFDGPPAADTRQPHSLGFYTRPLPARSVSLYSSSQTSAAFSSSSPSSSSASSQRGSGARRLSDFTFSSYRQASGLDLSSSQVPDDILSEDEPDLLDSESSLAGLGLVDSLPAAPRVVPKRLSATSQVSLADSIPSSILSSSSSTVSLSSVEQQLTSSWSDVPTMQTWFSTCPPTPPSSIRLQLEFRSLPPPLSPALSSSSPSQTSHIKPRPLSSIFISSNSSVLDLKETIALRMAEIGYRLSPKNLTLTLHLNEDVRTHPVSFSTLAPTAKTKTKTALGLNLSVYGQNPAKVLDDKKRLLFEEGVQEDDLVLVDCDPSLFLWSI